MKVNPKKNLTLVNNTHYFKEGVTKVYKKITNPNTYFYKKSKTEGYEDRLYWEYKYCNEHNGQTFFFTLTYNDKNVPKYEGQNCFDYEDLRYLLNGGFTKFLLRNYGTKIKYFVSAELGEGKGNRGLHNNPHYHILFFTRSAESEEYPYKKIEPKEFRSLLRMYWQGFDEDIDGYRDYRTAKKGIVKEGKYGIVVNGFQALNYAAKYVTKDVTLKAKERNIESTYREQLMKTILDDPECKRRFWNEVIVPENNFPKNGTSGEYEMSDKELLEYLVPGYDYLLNEVGNPTIEDYASIVITNKNLILKYKDFCDDIIEERVKVKVNEFRNRYSNKCRISQGVGDYAIKFMDKTDPVIKIPTKKGYKNRQIGLYYYRKLFTDVVKDYTGQPIRILNKDGIIYEVKQLSKRIDKLVDKTISNLNTITPEIYNDMYYSDINTGCFIKYDEMEHYINTLDIQKIIRHYAEYKLVYEDRFFKLEDDGYPKIDIISDYTTFITPVMDKVKYRIDPVNRFIENNYKGYMAYNSHPYFLPDSWLFPLFDMVSDYYFIKEDDVMEEEQKKREQTRRFHIDRGLEW